MILRLTGVSQSFIFSNNINIFFYYKTTAFLYLTEGQIIKTILDVGFETLKISSQVLLKSKYLEWRTSLGSMVIKNPDQGDTYFPELIHPQETDANVSSTVPNCIFETFCYIQ